MIDLRRLKVSLTKHGAHKVAELIKNFPVDHVLDNVWDTYEDIKIDLAQTKRNLSVNIQGKLPSIWEKVKEIKNNDAVDSLVLLAIIFSHHDLIKAMIESSSSDKKGKLIRGSIIHGKAYTNFACILDELGFAKEHTPDYIKYDLSNLFEIADLPALVKELLKLKLSEAGWDGKSDIVDECIKQKFNNALSLTEDQFRKWLSGVLENSFDETKGEEIEEEPTVKDFKFVSGHKNKKEGSLKKSKKTKPTKATLLHNEIQNGMYEHLCKIKGKDYIGTELDSGIGTEVDLVEKDGGKYIFYEIKTNKSVRLCLREAIPQLLEYSYWPDRDIASKLIIVSQNEITEQAKVYLQHLRKKFALPLFYQRFDIKRKVLVDIY